VALEIETRRKEKQMTEGKYTLEEELYKTEDGEVVRAGTGRAAFLYKPVGAKIPFEEAIELGLVSKKAAKAAEDAGDGNSGDGSEEDLTKLKRPQLDAIAKELGVEEPDKLDNRGLVIEAIEAARKAEDAGDGNSGDGSED
jgi:hypothetical protein